MPELRFNRATREWVIVAGERAARPQEHAEPARRRALPARRADCDFCPGNEHRTPAAVLESRAPRARRWAVRAFPNKYPALAGDPEIVPDAPPPGEPQLVGLSATGLHEVIVETALHNRPPALMDDEEAARVVLAWRERARALAALPWARHVALFKNQGREAGTSLEHPHSQIVALPFLPALVRRRLEIAAEEQRAAGCLLCRTIAAEERDGARVISAGEHYLAVAPFASARAGETWILPRRHVLSFPETTDAEARTLGSTLRRALRGLREGFGDPDFNLLVNSAPPGVSDVSDAPGAHWHVRIAPRITRAAGLELATGVFVNPLPPERVAEVLRAVGS